MKGNSFATVYRIIAAVFIFIGVIFLAVSVVGIILNFNGFPDINDFNEPNAVFIIFPFIGFLFFIIGLVFAVYPARKKREAKRLMEEGSKIIASIEDVAPNTSVRVNGRYPYVIHCSWRDSRDGVTYHFRSGDIWFNPINLLQERSIQTLPVYIDRNNIKKYYVSLESVENNNVFL